MRQQMEAHRANPACASCHKFMDPLGFAMENFDATGKWRDTENGSKINASGVTPDGFPLNGPADCGITWRRGPISSPPRSRKSCSPTRRPRHGRVRLPRHSQDRARLSEHQLQMVVSRARDCGEHPVPDEEISGAMMVITQKALPRRTVLRGLGRDGGAASSRRDGARARPRAKRGCREAADADVVPSICRTAS
jgi:hypothetical protein